MTRELNDVMMKVIEAEARTARSRALNDARAVLNHVRGLSEAMESGNLEDFTDGQARVLAADVASLCAEIGALTAIRKIQTEADMATELP